jgi:DNA-binding transcriptional MerR regulator
MSSAAFAYQHKSAEAFRTISEVAIELDVPQHVLRFWESRFAQIKPVKRAGGRRYYRPDDIDLLKGIRALLYSDGLTIRGVQKVLKERGHRHVADLGRGEMHVPEPQEPQVPQVQVVEKIVYVERPAVVAAPEPAPKAKKSRTHLRAVPDTLSLPFFDQPVPSREFPVLDAAPALVVETVTDFDVTDEPVVEIAPEGPVDDGLTDDALANEGLANEGLAAADRERLEELLDELSGLKTRLQAAREAIQN